MKRFADKLTSYFMGDQKFRHAIFDRDHYECVYCGRRLKRKRYDKNRTLDHIAPVSAMLDVHMEVVCHPNNLVTACVTCNRKLANTSMFEKVFKYGRFRRVQEEHLDAPTPPE